MSAPSTPSARKNVLITGCSKGGMGYDMAKALALRPNYEVWATARSLEKMEGLPESVHLVVREYPFQ